MEYCAARCSPNPTSADFNFCGSPVVTASISTSGTALLAGCMNRAAGFNACKSSTAWPGRTLLTWRDISASEASNFDADALWRCCKLRLPATCS
ncbi:MAG TPA: hypothetical protein VK794_07520 [Steroidobacteraceae bacterium]|nr:hypothetical protein [Steroidobacteraceae bacterium]